MLKRPRENFSLPPDIFECILDQLVGSSSSIYAVVTKLPDEIVGHGWMTHVEYWSSLVCKLRLVCKSMKARVAALFAAMSHPNQFFSYLDLDAFAQSHLLNPCCSGLRDKVRIYFHVVWARYQQPCMLTREHRPTDAVQVMTAFTQWYNRFSTTHKAALHACKPFWRRLAFILGEPEKMVKNKHVQLRAAVHHAASASCDEQGRAQTQLDNFEDLQLLTPSAVLDKHGDL